MKQLNPQTQQYIKYAEAMQADKKVIYWVKHTLNNYLSKNDPTIDEVEHIIDYLVSSEAPRLMNKVSYIQEQELTWLE